MNAEVAVQHAIRLRRADRTRAAGMVSPRMRLNEIRELVVALDLIARQFLARYQTSLVQLVRHATNESYAFYDRLQIVASSSAEVVEVDVRRVERVRRSQRDRARAIRRVTFEHDPRERV